MNKKRVTILCSDPAHPVNAWLSAWSSREAARADVTLCRDVSEVGSGDTLFLISCQQIVKADVRARFRHTLVLHASDLPKGRGMSPHIWQIVEGADRIVLTMLEAEDGFDTGAIWHQAEIHFDGTELYDEINAKIFDAEVALMTWALDHAENPSPRAQADDEPSYYRRRTPEDSRVDPLRPLAESFDLLRVADPSRYPAFFEYRGQRYRIRIEKVAS